MNQSDLKQLIERYSKKEASPEEIRELYQLAYENKFDDELKSLLLAQLENTDLAEDYNIEEWNLVFEKIKDDIATIEEEVPGKMRRIRFVKFGIAAAVITTIISIGIWLLITQVEEIPTEQFSIANDISPGQIGATLTLASGKKISLSAVTNGELAKEAGVVIYKSKNGELIYEIKENASNGDNPNTLSTAKGETYCLKLPDGSIVWLNAASSLTYSANLTANGIRRVKLEGEGYFEVAKDDKHPFVVESKGQKVEVLGTHFNIQAYSDEPLVQTTLLEGLVKVTPENGKSKIIYPGQQSRLSDTEIDIINIDAEIVTSWKNNLFLFENQDLASIMRMISRWYNVEVIYVDNVMNEKFGGGLSRFDHVSKVLKSLEETGNIHFKLQGRTIYVSK